MLGAPATAEAAGDIDRNARSAEPVLEGETDAALTAIEAAVEREGRASRRRQRRRLGDRRRGRDPRRASVLTVSMRLDNVPICAPRLAMSCGLKLAVARLPAASLVTNWVGPTCTALLASEVMPGAA